MNHSWMLLGCEMMSKVIANCARQKRYYEGNRRITSSIPRPSTRIIAHPFCSQTHLAIDFELFPRDEWRVVLLIRCLSRGNIMRSARRTLHCHRRHLIEDQLDRVEISSREKPGELNCSMLCIECVDLIDWWRPVEDSQPRVLWIYISQCF